MGIIIYSLKQYFIFTIVLFFVCFGSNSTTYYVNDGLTSDDIYCIASGAAYNAVSNDGLSNDEPLESLASVIAAHGPGGTNLIADGDIFYIDAGIYYQTDANLGLNLNNISIIGAGSDLTYFDNDAASSDANRWANIYGNNILIEGVYLTGYNYGFGDGIALQIDGAINFIMNDVMVNENLPGGGSSAIFITGGSTGSFNGGGASCNPPNPSVAGGGVNIEGNGNVVSFSNYNLSNNSKDLQGGAAMRIDGDATTLITITNSLLEGNKTTGGEGGGAILILNGAQLAISGTCFNGNNASKVSSVNYGGAIMVGEGSDVIISNCSFDSNYASPSGNGGAIAINSTTGSSGGTPTVSVSICSFTNNLATDGNDVFTRGSDGGIITATECTWSSTASDELHIDGGSITVDFSGTADNTGGVVFDNVIPSSSSPSTICPSAPAPCFTALALPIELLFFTAECNGSLVDVFWSTATEVNNDYFILEKSQDGDYFEEIAIVDGAGSSSELQNYSISDRKSNNQPVYYRLSQVDFDGERTVFPVIVLDQNCGSEEMPIELIANLSSNTILVHYDLEKSAHTVLNLIDVSGKIVFTEGVLLSKNKRVYQSNEFGSLQNGMYFIQLVGESIDQASSKFLISY